MLVRPLVVLSDLHLGPTSQEALTADVARLIDAHPAHEILLNGDTFALSADLEPTDPFLSADRVLGLSRHLRTALSSHLARGSPVTLLAGNHDAALGLPEARARLLLLLNLPDSAPLTLVPWFVRRGRVHIEHGHVYDPDNAPAHPLAPWCSAVEPLGVALTRRLIAPFAADRFAHAYDTTPGLGLWRALGTYGPRGLAVAFGYFVVAFSLVLRAGKSGRSTETLAAASTGYGQSHGLTAEQTEALLGIRALPTHHSRVLTFRRLYLDRALAFVCLLFGLLGAWMTGAPGLWWADAVGGTLLFGSLLVSGSRYRGLTEARLRRAARRIAQATSADLVVFGHSHWVESSPGYFNTGHFASADGPGRRYLLIETNGRASLNPWPP